MTKTVSEVVNPQGFIEGEVAKKLAEVFKPYVNLDYKELKKLIEEPPRAEFGDLAIPLGRLRKYCERSMLMNLVKHVIEEITKHELIRNAKIVSGFLNIFLNKEKYTALTLNSVSKMKENYGKTYAKKKLRIVIEFVSANPIHPLHIGSGRNAVLGDFIARILNFVGHEIQKRFYIDDVGRQVSILTLGYKLLGEPEPPANIKVDHWFGYIYAITHTLLDIIRVKRQINELKSKKYNEEEIKYKLHELDKLMAVAAELHEKSKELFDRLMNKITQLKDPEAEVSKITLNYEKGEPNTVRAVRKVISYVLKGFQETLKELGITFDKWDWESDLIWSGLVNNVIKEASKTPYYTFFKGAPALDFSALLDETLRKTLKIPKYLEIPPLILRRSDGSTLYTTRDIAYSIFKFKDFNADKVINVIASEQTLPQAQLRLSLYALGYKNYAINLVHYDYEMVNLPGLKMSGRRGRYVTIDEVIDKCKEKVKEILAMRNVKLKDNIIKDVAIAAFKFAMLSVSPKKPLTFKFEEVTNFERNSGPYIQYTHARASSVLRKYGKDIEWNNIGYEYVNENDIRWELIKFIGKFPKVIIKLADDLDPEYLATYLIKLADKFNKWYDSEPIINDPIKKRQQLKLAITYSVKTIFKNGLELLGIPAPERM